MECKNDPTGGSPYWDPNYDHLISPFPECITLRKYFIFLILMLLIYWKNWNGKAVILWTYKASCWPTVCKIKNVIELYFRNNLRQINVTENDRKRAFSVTMTVKMFNTAVNWPKSN